MKKYFWVSISVLIIAVLFIFSRIERREADTNLIIMGTPTHISVQSRYAPQILAKAVQKMQRLEKVLYWNNPKSEVSLINQLSGTAAVAVTDDTYDLIHKSLVAAQMTTGAFSPALGPLIDLWREAEKRGTPPSVSELTAAVKVSPWKQIQLDPALKTVKLPLSGMKLNLDGIGKGYAVEKAMESFKQAGATSAMIDMGSSIGVLGTPPNNVRPDTGAAVVGPVSSTETYWKIGVTDPRDPDKILGTIYLVSGETLSTSGSYRQSYLIAGKVYNHIFDPATGLPANGCLAATIVSTDPTLADALSTAVFELGSWKGAELVRSFSGVEALIVKTDGNLITTPGLRFERTENTPEGKIN